MTQEDKIESVVSYHLTRVVEVIGLSDSTDEKTKKIVTVKNDLVTAIGNVLKN